MFSPRSCWPRVATSGWGLWRRLWHQRVRVCFVASSGVLLGTCAVLGLCKSLLLFVLFVCCCFFFLLCFRCSYLAVGTWTFICIPTIHICVSLFAEEWLVSLLALGIWVFVELGWLWACLWVRNAYSTWQHRTRYIKEYIRALDYIQVYVSKEQHQLDQHIDYLEHTKLSQDTPTKSTNTKT